MGFVHVLILLMLKYLKKVVARDHALINNDIPESYIFLTHVLRLKLASSPGFDNSISKNQRQYIQESAVS